MNKTSGAVGINIGSAFARCAYGRAYTGGAEAVPVMIPNRWKNVSTPSAEALAEGGGAFLSRLFRSLREDAEVFLGQFVSSCVLAVPACFTPTQTREITGAAEEAGITGVSVISEPEAAAVALGGGGRVMILDCGASASDISVASVAENGGSHKQLKTWEILESVRSETCGRTFDLALAEWLAERLELAPMPDGDPRRRALALEAEAVKTALSSSLFCDWQPAALPELNFSPLRVEREELERMIRFPIKRLVNAAGRLWEKHKPERLLLTGGSARIPLLRETVERGIARPERTPFGAEDAVAAGAAIYAAFNHAGRGPAPIKSPEGGQRVRELKMRLMRTEPSLSAAHKKRLHFMLGKLDNMAGDASSMETLEEIIQELEKELF